MNAACAQVENQQNVLTSELLQCDRLSVPVDAIELWRRKWGPVARTKRGKLRWSVRPLGGGNLRNGGRVQVQRFDLPHPAQSGVRARPNVKQSTRTALRLLPISDRGIRA